MTIVNHPDWDLSERGKKDAERHRKKIDDAIRKNVKDVISEESIITRKKGKTVRVPVKGLKDYRFIHGKNKKGQGQGEGDGEGAGQGQGQPGDVIGRRPKKGDGKGKGQAGNQPGEDFLETEVDIDYLIKIMFEDLGLPWIEEKIKASTLVPSGWKFETISKVGILPRVHKKRTMLEAIKRNELYAKEIVEETGCDHENALRALAQSQGDINGAIDIINKNELDISIDPYVMIEDDDMRYKQIEEDYELHSNAVVIAMMDTSGSMTTDKKYLCRSLLFWLTEFLKKVYDFVDIKFITHTTDAKLVDEETFFHKGESGGTYCWTAIDKALYLIDTEYPVEEWNVYCIYVSDGDDFDSDKTVKYIEELLKRKINMFAYTEVDPGRDAGTNATTQTPAWGLLWSSGNTLIKKIKEKWTFACKKEEGTEFCKNEEKHFLLSVITDKAHVYPTLKHILFKEDR
jgi:sporulation protein YhbH